MTSFKSLCCDVCKCEFIIHLGQANTKLKKKAAFNHKIYCSKTCRDIETLKRRAETLDLCCHQCNTVFKYPKIKAFSRIARNKLDGTKIFCSIECRRYHNNWGSPKTIKCDQCNKEVVKFNSEILRNDFHFCNCSCATLYKNSHKTTGIFRSKLELWLEEQLYKIYPSLNIMYCDKTTINSELDIYIPSIQLAFELNGIFHYEPIFGQNKLDKTINNDKRKFQACLENNIELCIIDTSKESYFKPSKCQKYLDIITEIINHKSIKSNM